MRAHCMLSYRKYLLPPYFFDSFARGAERFLLFWLASKLGLIGWPRAHLNLGRRHVFISHLSPTHISKLGEDILSFSFFRHCRLGLGGDTSSQCTDWRPQIAYSIRIGLILRFLDALTLRTHST